MNVNIEQAIMQTTNSILTFQKNFSNYLTSNYLILLIASSVCIGFATKDMISDIMHESVLPIVIYFTVKTIPYFIYNKTLEYSSKYKLIHLLIHKLGRLFWIIIVWILTLYITYIVFRSITRIDLITGRVNALQSVTKYVLGEKTNQESLK